MKIILSISNHILDLIPKNVIDSNFKAKLYAIVDRKPHKILNVKYGDKARLEPCFFDMKSKTITIHIPENINPGIESLEDIDDNYFEGIQIAFINIILNSL